MFSPLFIRRWVYPFYMQILHGNYASHLVVGEDRERFNSDVHRALKSITLRVTSKLIRSDNWREVITGSWFAGLKGYTECRDQIGERLLASTMCYAGQSHAFAMACFADEASIDYLTQYLDIYLKRHDCYYDQNWAMPSLMWIDHLQSTKHSDRFLAPNGPWDQFTADKICPDNDAWTLESCRRRFWETMDYCRKHFI